MQELRPPTKPIKVRMPPAIMQGEKNNWIVAGCMIPVPKDLRQEDIGKWVEYEKPSPPTQVYRVKGSSGNAYTVHHWRAGRWTCDCAGFKFHKRCKHVTEAQNTHGQIERG